MSGLSVKLVNSSQAGGKNAESESVRAALRCLPSHAHTEWADGGHLALQAAWFSDHCGDVTLYVDIQIHITQLIMSPL